MTNKANLILDELDTITSALAARGFTEKEIADEMLSFAMALSVKVRGVTDVARHCQAMALQLTAKEQIDAQATRH